MSTPSVGSLTLEQLDGVVDPPGLLVELLEEGGVDGYGMRQAATRAPVSQLSGYADYTDVTTARNTAAGAKALLGTYVTVTRDDGYTCANCAVLAVRANSEPIMVLVDGNTRYRIQYAFDVRMQTP